MTIKLKGKETMANYITKEIGLDNYTSLPDDDILYTSWTVKEEATDEIVYFIEKDEVNKTSKLFSGVFEIGKRYLVYVSMVRKTGPTVTTPALVLDVTDNKDIIDLYPMPSVVDTPILSAEHPNNAIPMSNFRINANPMNVSGNAVHESSHWWITDDTNKVIWESLEDKSNLNSIVVRGVVLSTEKIYTMHCVFEANNNDTSGTGTFTFRVSDMSELDIIGDLNDSFYSKEVLTSLKDIKDGVDKFEYELRTPAGALLYSDTNQSGVIYLPVTSDNKTVLDVNEGLDYYVLRVRLTLGAVVIGWREFTFLPKVWSVQSDVTDDINHTQTNALSSKRITIDSCLPNTFNTVHPAGVIHQLQDGLFLMHYANGLYGLFEWIDEVSKFSLVKEVNLLGILPANNKKTDDWFMTNKVLKNGLIAVQPFKETGSVSSLYILEYNTITKEFKFLRNTNGVMVTAPTLDDNMLLLMENGMLYTYDTMVGVKYAIGETTFLGLENRLISFKMSNRRYKINDPVDKQSIIITVANDGKSAIVSSKFADNILPDLNWTTRSVMRNGKSYIYQKEVGGGAVRTYGLNNNITGVSYFVDGDSDIVGRLDQEIVLGDGRKIFVNTVSPEKSLIFS